MRRVHINTGKIGLVYRKGDLQRVIRAGSHWVALFRKVEIYNLGEAFQPGRDLNLYLMHPEMREALEVVKVADSQIALCFENGTFRGILTPGRYAYWKGLIDRKFILADLDQVEISEEISRELLGTMTLRNYIRAYNIASYEKGLLFIDGAFVKTLTRGDYYFWKNSIPVQVLKVDVRNRRMELSGQEMLTKDKAALRINFVAEYRVTDLEKALVDNKDYEGQLYVLLQLALRSLVAQLSLDELLAQKENTAGKVQAEVQKAAAELGVKVGHCGIRDVILPGDMKEIMNQVLVAEKKAQASVITRREETASVRSMLNSARLMDENPMLLILKEMEYTEKIAERINSISLSGGNNVVDQLREIFSR